MNGQTFYSDGMKFRTQRCATIAPSPDISYSVVTLEQTEEPNCFNIYEADEDNESDKEFVAVMKTEGSKVFFKYNDSDASEWYLFYDFDLQPGEGCYFYNPCFKRESAPLKSYLKCTGIEKSYRGSEWDLILLEEYEDDNCSVRLRTGSWLKGLSSLGGFLFNNGFGLDGICSRLMEVSDNGNVIYSVPETGVSEVADLAVPSVRIDGLNVYVSMNDAARGSIYTLSGACLGNYSFGKTPTRIQLPEKGAYILKTGNISKKIFVR